MPLVLTIVLPSIFVFVLTQAPDAASDFQKLLDKLPITNGEYSQQQVMFRLVLNYIMPLFFLIIPILALVIGQFTGIILISTWILLGLGAVLLILDVLLMKGIAKNFTYEKLLR